MNEQFGIKQVTREPLIASIGPPRRAPLSVLYHSRGAEVQRMYDIPRIMYHHCAPSARRSVRRTVHPQGTTGPADRMTGEVLNGHLRKMFVQLTIL